MLSFYEDNENHDYLYIYDSKDNAYLKVPEWDYSFDDYELDYLEQGYNISICQTARMLPIGH